MTNLADIIADADAPKSGVGDAGNASRDSEAPETLSAIPADHSKPVDGDGVKPRRKLISLPSPPSVKVSSEHAMIAGGVLAAIVVTFFVWFLFFATHEEHGEIESFRWERKIEVIDFQPRRRASWYSHPSDAYNVSSSWRIHHYETGPRSL